MSDAPDDIIDQLLDEWESARREGRSISVSQLCREHPELIEDVKDQIAAVEWVRHRQEQFFSPGSANAQAQFDRPKSLGRFVLEEIVGAGGFGVVWKAFDPELNRQVAIKLPQFTSDEDREICIQEAQHLAGLDHPNIVKIFDVGRENGDVFLVAQFVDGQNLAERMANGSIELDEGLQILATVCLALQYAHGQGVVHRDIKPQNILIDSTGRVLLADFGISIESATPVVSDLRGTFPYQAPEQMTPGDMVDARADLFSLGVVAYEMFTGRLPFKAGVQGRFNREPVTPPHELNPQLPRSVSDAIMRALEPFPADRMSSAGEFLKSLSEGRSNLLTMVAGVILLAVLATAITFWSGPSTELPANSMGVVEPLAWFDFNNRDDPLWNRGAAQGSFSIRLRGNCDFVPSSMTPNPPSFLQDVARLQRGPSRFPADKNLNPGFVCNKDPIICGHAFSISFWYCRQQAGDIDTLLHIGEADGFGLSTNPQLTVWVDNSDKLGVLSFERFPQVPEKRAQLNESVPITEPLDGWHHILITFDAGTMPVLAGRGVFRLYLDGSKMIERGNVNFGPLLRNTKSRISFGASLKQTVPRLDWNLDGYLDEIRMWNRALREEEAKELAAR